MEDIGEKRVAIISAIATYILVSRPRKTREAPRRATRLTSGWRIAAHLDAVMTDEYEEVQDNSGRGGLRGRGKPRRR